MNDLVLIYIKEEYYKVVSFLVRNNIYYEDLYLKDNKVYLKTNEENIEKLSLFFSVKVLKYYGLKGTLNFLKKHYIFLISLIIGYIAVLVLSNTIFEVEVISSNSNLRETVLDNLSENGIKKYKFVKSKKEIDKIKEKILKENETTLEWIEIERVGTKYTVNLTERVITVRNEDERKTDIVASKDGMIKYILVNKGSKVKEVNELVKKGETIISGSIMKDETLVDTVNASGRVYAEVWYKVNTTVPYKHIVYEKTGEVINHVYLEIFGKKFTLMGKYETNMSMNEEELLVEKPYLFFKIVNEKKELYTYKEVNLTEEEALEEALNRSDKVILDKLSLDEYIIDKKVLKKNAYSSKIDIEVFYRVYENIALETELKPIETKEGE